MRVLISNDDGLDILLQAEEMEQAVACMLKAEGADPSSDVEVSISFVRPAEMRALNASWRGIDAPTDVLSFECDGLGGARSSRAGGRHPVPRGHCRAGCGFRQYAR